MNESEKIKTMIDEVEAKKTEAEKEVAYCKQQLKSLNKLHELALEKEKK